MDKKYGGVKNQKTLDEIQEATIVVAPIFRKKQPKSKASVIWGWLVYWIMSWVITTLFIVAVGLFEQMNRLHIPWWMQSFIIPSIPFALALVWLMLKFKKSKNIKDAGD